MSASKLRGSLAVVACILAGGVTPLGAAQDVDAPRSLEERAFTHPALNLTSRHAPLDEMLASLPNRAAWRRARSAAGTELTAFIDPRSGAASNLIVSVPLIPGAGVANTLALSDVSARLGRTVERIDERAVAELVLRFVVERAELLGIDLAELGAARAVQVSDVLWQVSFAQQVDRVRVRDALLVVTISHGNVVLLGTQRFGRVSVDTRPALSEGEALEAGFAGVGGRAALDTLVRDPLLELMTTDATGAAPDAAFAGAPGAGYDHRLVWSFRFRRAPEAANWEVLVDAGDGELLALRDVNASAVRDIRGGVYPLTNTEECATPSQCGVMGWGWPMPFADTGLFGPSGYADSAGQFAHSGGSPVTTLDGRYFQVNDACGALSQTPGRLGDLDLGGSNGQHDCDRVGSLGNTPAARTAYYELNRIAEQGRGWLPNNVWLQSKVTVNTNIDEVCNAFWDDVNHTLNFYRSGTLNNAIQPTCRNTGEIAGFLDHEWGHGLDQFDANALLSNSTEAYADVAALYRLNASCIGHGFIAAFGQSAGCGLAADGSPNRNEAKVAGLSHCALDCSGLRDADYLQHEGGQPDTAVGFVCGACKSGTSLCGRESHCAATPVRQAAWDLVARDLKNPPFNLNGESALIVGTRLFYQGSGNVGDWHACTCGNPSGGSSSGCGATNGYMQWLAADDDNGNLADGTPHMTALFAAFDRHGIACASPLPVNSGCVGGPASSVSLSVLAGSNTVTLSWLPVSGAEWYLVFRSEGHGGCQAGKTLIATVSKFSAQYVDNQVANGRTYFYNVVPRGATPACHGSAGVCKHVTPVDNVPPLVEITSPAGDASVLGNAFAVTASASDDVRVAKVEFYVNGVLKSSDASAPYGFTVALPTPGNYSVLARAYDSSSNVTDSTPRLIVRVGGGFPIRPESTPGDTPARR